MREFYEVIAGTEGQAVRLAAERADAEMVRHLEAALADQEAAPDAAGSVYERRGILLI